MQQLVLRPRAPCANDNHGKGQKCWFSMNAPPFCWLLLLLLPYNSVDVAQQFVFWRGTSICVASSRRGAICHTTYHAGAMALSYW